MTRTITTTVVRETYEYKKAEPGAEKESRLYTVSDMDNRPFIRLRGKWLEDAGFHIGDKLAVSVNENRLVIFHS